MPERVRECPDAARWAPTQPAVARIMVQVSPWHVPEPPDREGLGGPSVRPRRRALLWKVTAMESPPFQDLVDWHCYGCGRLNEHGLHIKSQWDGDEVVCRWQAEPFHVGLPGRLQGGVIATAIICHALWTATATACRNEGTQIEEPMGFAYSTTSVQLEFLAPVPVDGLMTLRARVITIDGDTATVSCSVFVDDRETTRARSEHRRISLPS